jgi:hypothetical protein
MRVQSFGLPSSCRTLAPLVFLERTQKSQLALKMFFGYKDSQFGWQTLCKIGFLHQTIRDYNQLAYSKQYGRFTATFLAAQTEKEMHSR